MPAAEENLFTAKTLVVGRNPSGVLVAIRVDEDGYLLVSGLEGGGGGTILLPADSDNLQHQRVTLGTAESASTVTVPDDARGFILYSLSDFRYRVGGAPAAVSTGAVGAGALGRAGVERVHILTAGTSRSIQLKSTTASAVIDVSFFS